MKTNFNTTKKSFSLILGLAISIFSFGQDELSYLSNNESTTNITSVNSISSTSTLLNDEIIKSETYQVTSLDDPNYIELETRIVVDSETNTIIVENLADVKDLGKIIVTDESGLIVKVKPITESEMSIDWSDLGAGKYILRVSVKNRFLSSYEIVKY
jgi:hypothetical protein